MVLSEKIQEYIQKLPPSFQEELFDYIEFLRIIPEKRGDEKWQSDKLKHV